MTDDQYGITTSLFARASAPTERPDEPEDDQDGTVEVPAEELSLFHPAHEAVSFKHHTQRGQREQTRGLPANLKTNPLGPPPQQVSRSDSRL